MNASAQANGNIELAITFLEGNWIVCLDSFWFCRMEDGVKRG